MKKNLKVEDYEDKKSKDGKRYTRFNLGGKWMTCFDSITAEKLKALEGAVACVDVVEKGEYTNVVECYGQVDESEAQVYKEQVPVVKVGEPKKEKNAYPKDPVGLAVEVFNSAWNNNTETHPEDAMKISIALVKQAQEAFS